MVIRNDKTFYDWLFHYNVHNDQWFAFHREDQHSYWNGAPAKHVIINHHDLKVLMTDIQETAGDIQELKKRYPDRARK